VSDDEADTQTMYGHTNPKVRSTEEGEQVGPKMHVAVKLAAEGPALRDADVFTSKNDLATSVGPNGSSDFGNRIVNRCISKGLISRPDPDHDNANPHGLGAVYATDKGAQYLEDN